MTETNTFNADAPIVELAYASDTPVVAPEPTKLEAAANALVDYIATLADNRSIEATELRRLADTLEDASARSTASRISTPRLLEVTGNVAERELAARHCESKAKGAAFHAKHSRRGVEAHEFEHIGAVMTALAAEFRTGIHLPEVEIPGRVIPYNQDNDTGVKHSAALTAFFTDVHARNVKAGWWSDLESGEPKKRNLGELLVLMVTEMAEAYEAWTQGCQDNKLPDYPGLGVELADLGIRWADTCGALLAGRILEPEPQVPNPGDAMFREICEIAWRYEAIRKTPQAVGAPEVAGFLPPQDVAVMTDAKLAFNAKRPDHKLENRLKEDGKRT